MKHEIKKSFKMDLHEIEGSMAFIIENNHDRFDVCSTVAELVNVLKAVFKENNLNTKASNRLIQNVARKNDFTYALMTVYDSYLFGSNLAVGRK